MTLAGRLYENYIAVYVNCIARKGNDTADYRLRAERRFFFKGLPFSKADKKSQCFKDFFMAPD